MHEYDITLKLLLSGSAQATVRELTGGSIEEWLNVELPKFQNPRVDLLGEASDGSLVHIELQSSNDPKMALRMAEYAFGVYRLFGRFPRQILVYVGEAAWQMTTELKGPGVIFNYEAVNLSELDSERLLSSEQTGDNVIAILARFRDRKAVVQDIIGKLSGLDTGAREFHLGALLTLAGLRGLEDVVEEEARKVPILNDILEHKVLGREFKRGLEQGLGQGMVQGLEQGLEQGREKGAHQEALALLRRLIEKRFGSFPDWAEQRLADRPVAELEDLSLRVLDVKTIEELLA